MVVVLLVAVLLMGGCAKEEVDPNAPVPTVKAQLNISLPSRIAGKRAATRMTGDVVQNIPVDGNENDYFRGLSDVQLLCFNEFPTESSIKLGGVIDIKNSEMNEDIATKEDYSLCQQIDVPVGTTHFGFYAVAPNELSEEEIESEQYQTQHEKRMHFGALDAIGLNKQSYKGNSSIRFRPVQICTSTDRLGGSPKGLALLNLLNDLMKDIDPEGNLYLNEAYQRMTELTTLSSYHVQTMLGFILKMVNQEAPDDQGSNSVQSVTNLIVSSCDPETEPDIQNGVIVLKDNYQGFPADIYLPDGAARIKWDETEQLFVIPDKQKYSNDLQVTSVNDYVYPMNLQYQVFSKILASDELVVMSVDDDGNVVAPDTPQYDNWQDLITDGYKDAGAVVKESTQSVAMTKQVEYAVGRLAVMTRLSDDRSLKDAANKDVDVLNDPFTLKGYIVGSQREVGYDFQPVGTAEPFSIYDTDLNGGLQALKRHDFSEPDYILGLSTIADQEIMVAVELVNNGPAFQGADGTIVTGATFYLVANLNPREAKDGTYVPGSLDKVFIKDRATTVKITIGSLATATYGLPNLEIPRPTVGLSVDLSWEEGLWFDDVEL